MLIHSYLNKATRLHRHWTQLKQPLRQLSYLTSRHEIKDRYDAVVIGAGHNGLVAEIASVGMGVSNHEILDPILNATVISASYLQKAGFDVCVLERRNVVGGAAVTEELIPGFKFSRASYALSLLRPYIIEDLDLRKHGFKVYLRDPNSYTPLLEPQGSAKSLILSRSDDENRKQIGQFSKKDAELYGKYEDQLNRMVSAMEPLLDSVPIDLKKWTVKGSIADKWKNRKPIAALLRSVQNLGKDTPAFLEFMTAPATKILDKWFESEPLKATLATDATIGTMCSPHNSGSGYVLLHHVMGELEGIKGAWGYVEGGMGSVTQAMARSAASFGANIFTDTSVVEISVDGEHGAAGVVLEDGTEIRSKVVLSNATPKVTYIDLLEKSALPEDFYKEVSSIDYTSAATKINVALSRIPDFLADPCTKPNQPGPQHVGTIHLNCESTDLIHQAYLEALDGKPSSRPMIEMTLPSALDPTVAPAGAHVAQMFVQFTPYSLAGGKKWDEHSKQAFANVVFDTVEQYAPGFKQSIVGTDILTPPDLEEVFNLTGGNIFHGAISLDQLYFSRPTMLHSDHRCPVQGLYLCGSGSHPGGGVMGSAGRLAAQTVIHDIKNVQK